MKIVVWICFLVVCLILPKQTVLAVPAITAIWANDGEDKVTRDELRATEKKSVINSVWDGSKISIFGGRNEVVAFNLILEAGNSAAQQVSVSFDQLKGPSNSSITSAPVRGNDIFKWTGRSIELFYVRYLQIKGLSQLSYLDYDERHVPRRMRRNWLGNGYGHGKWEDRPDHDKYYPEIAVPIELVPTFTIAAKTNQSIWADIYIPTTTPPGQYSGSLIVREKDHIVSTLPVELKVYPFTLPDEPSAKTMLYYSTENIDRRYLGSASIAPESAAGIKARLIRDHHYLLAHRHRFSLIGDFLGDCPMKLDQPCAESLPRLDGSLFTADHGYDGPGVGMSNNVYSIGTYGGWSWNKGTESDMRQHTDTWVTWFKRNAPGVDYFLYLIDESKEYAQIETWAKWILNNPGPGHHMKSMATLPLPLAIAQTPSLDIPTSSLGVGIASQWQVPSERYTTDNRKRFYLYNGTRPASGSTAIEDDGVALRERAWGQYKKHINRWFFWETTYYNNYQGNMGETNVFQTAQTFGTNKSFDPIKGRTGWNYSNGDGVLFYPGTDHLYPGDSYGVDGPFASLRLKCWRRGIQDVDYLTMAAAIDPAAVQSIVNRIIPKVLWDYGVDNLKDPSYIRTDISWSTDPDVWEAARKQLADILLSHPDPQ